MDVTAILGSLGQIVLGGLLIGAGIPAVFAVGVRAWAGGPHPAGSPPVPSAGQRVLASLAFGIAGLAVVAGIVLIVLGGR